VIVTGDRCQDTSFIYTFRGDDRRAGMSR
jgi:hypothetical protein